MKPLFVLLGAYALCLLLARLVTGRFDPFLCGRIAMSVMLLFTAIGHFKFTTGMAMMMPSVIPFKTALVYLMGIIEIAAAIGLLLPCFQQVTAWPMIPFFVVILPANIHTALSSTLVTRKAPMRARVPLTFGFVCRCNSFSCLGSGTLPSSMGEVCLNSWKFPSLLRIINS